MGNYITLTRDIVETINDHRQQGESFSSAACALISLGHQKVNVGYFLSFSLASPVAETSGDKIVQLSTEAERIIDSYRQLVNGSMITPSQIATRLIQAALLDKPEKGSPEWVRREANTRGLSYLGPAAVVLAGKPR